MLNEVRPSIDGQYCPIQLDAELEEVHQMRSFSIILAATAIAALAIIIGRMTGTFDEPVIKGVVAAAIVVIFVGLFRFLPKHRG